MGQKVTIPIANGFYVSESLPLSAQECIGWYPNVPQAPALSPETLFGIPGLDELTTTGDFTADVNRGSHVKNDVPYFVNGDMLYRLNDDGDGNFSTVALGTVEGFDRVSMADNGTQLCIIEPGGKAYIYNEDAGTPFEEITDPDFRANGDPQLVVYLDGYFVFTTDEKKFIISALNDGLNYNALDFGSAEADPDRLVAPVVHDNTLYIFGTETLEAFQNIGGSGFPFQRIQGSVISKGLFGSFAAISAGELFAWIGGSVNESPAIWVSNGGEPQKISTTAIEQVLDGFTQAQIDESFAWTYAQKGAFFIGFTIANTSFVYDQITQRWHERRSAIDSALVAWRVNSLVAGYSRILVGDSVTGKIGALNRETYNEYGLPIFRRMAVQPMTNQSDAFSIASMELTVESGTGNGLENPQIRMDWSKDGKTFQDDRTRRFGKIGEYMHRAIWRRLGRFPRFAVFRWTMTDAAKPNLLRLEVEIA